jgi:SAM-dependent methyltransferase
MKQPKNLPKHLGGHMGKTHTDRGILKYLKNQFETDSMLDIGCGPGGQCYEAYDLNYADIVGIDGDFTLKRKPIDEITFVTHDYTKGKSLVDRRFDLVWSCEFVEHIEEQYLDNFMRDFCLGDLVVMTFHPPSKKNNPKHFNEQPESYWLDVFKNYGFKFEPEILAQLKKESTMKREFFQKNGLVFSQ